MGYKSRGNFPVMVDICVVCGKIIVGDKCEGCGVKYGDEKKNKK